MQPSSGISQSDIFTHVNKLLIALVLILGAAFGGYQWLSQATIDVNPASIAKNMSYEQMVEMCDALTQEGSDIDGSTSFDACMQGMLLAKKGIPNQVIPDISQNGGSSSSDSETGTNGNSPTDSSFPDAETTNSGNSATSSTPEVVAYAAALGTFSTSGFQTMMSTSFTGSPAWNYAYHLYNGRLSQRQAGGSDGNSINFSNELDGFRFCFTSSCEMLLDNFRTQQGQVFTFDVNGTELSENVFANSDDSSYVCGAMGACAILRSVTWFGGTAFATVEVKTTTTSAGKAIKAAVRLLTPSGQNISLTSGSTPAATSSTNAHYSIGFKNATSPWGGEVRVKIKTSLGTETLALPVR